ncbi:membrane-bound lytic murein transglycosylase MltF [Salinisphaera aquimarina]|uniref:Membrane-bound lytic murein transglycosylase F n=1 Tax=Salinisphaera aquimarina TaxID=2094031 RepID=A0ABV7ET38_9GAMM
MTSLRLIIRCLRILTLTALAFTLATCTTRPGLLDQIDTLGTLRVATVNSAMTYYLDAGGPTGFEYDLARDFADQLGLRLKVMVLPDRQAVLDAVASGRAHIGAGLAVSDERRERVRFTPAYNESKLEAVYRVHQKKPKSLSDLSGQLILPPDTALADWLKRNHPELDFKIDDQANTEELMDRVASGDLDVTIANADIVAMNQRYYPNLRVAFDLPTVRQRLAWAFTPGRPDGRDDALYNEAIAFLEKTKADGRMRILRDRYFGHIERLGFVGGQEFARQVDARLDKWRAYFKRAAKEYSLDWRLLAAIGYQESHWDKDAVSPTTVRGIMMLTQAAASEVDVTNRRDPQQSIDGGARYFIQMLERLPNEIKPPDRAWFALAAYNIGYGHVMDARRLLKARKRDPNLWVNLRDALPWLTQERYLSGTKYGYARGLEAAAYVGNIRAYYDILLWMTDDKTKATKPAALDEEESEAGAQTPTPPDISIDSPAF